MSSNAASGTGVNIDVSAVEALGFTVECNTERTSDNVPYFLKGPRGARYALWRNRVHPHLMFVVNDRPGKLSMNVSARGYTWFSDKGGRLTPLR